MEVKPGDLFLRRTLGKSGNIRIEKVVFKKTDSEYFETKIIYKNYDKIYLDNNRRIYNNWDMFESSWFPDEITKIELGSVLYDLFS